MPQLLLAAPFLTRTTGAQAQATGPAKRLLVFFTPNGTVPRRWRPEGSGRSYQIGSSSMLAPLAGRESELLLLGNMDFNVGDNHEGGMRNMLTCGGDISIDQVVADHIGGSSRFRSLELSALTSAWGGSTQTRMAYRDGAFLTPDDDPLHAFQRLFGDLGDDVALARRKSVIDVARAELSDLQGRLGSEGRQHLEAHLEGLRSVERSLLGTGSCDAPIPPSVANPRDNDAFPDVAKAQIDLAVQALACGATNVVSVQLSHTVSPVVFTWIGESQAHHELSHMNDGNTAGVESFVRCEQWCAEQFGYLLDQLEAAVDGETGSSLADGTLVLWVKELGDSRAHVCKEVPWVIAGRNHGLATGQFVDLNQTHDGVLTTVAQAFGLNQSQFGTGSTGPIEEITA